MNSALTNASLPFKVTFDHPFSVFCTSILLPFSNLPTTFDSVVGFSRTFSTSVVTTVSALADDVKIPRPKLLLLLYQLIFHDSLHCVCFRVLIIATDFFGFGENTQLQTIRNKSLISCNITKI